MELVFNIVKQYGWQSLVVAIATFIMIECIKPLARKWFKKTQVRHTLYTICNYAFTFGFSAFLSWVLGRFGDLSALFGSSIIVVNILYPVIANVGIFAWLESVAKSLFDKVTKEGKWKELVKELSIKIGIGEEIINLIISRFESEYALQLGADVVSFLLGNESELLLNLKQKLAGFVDNAKLNEVSEQLLDSIKAAWVGFVNKE